MTTNARIAVVLTLALACGCGDYTPDNPTPARSPSPSPGPPAAPVPPGATFTMLGTTPAAGGTVVLSPRPFDLSRSPVVEFQFTYPADLTLGIGAGQTNFFLALLRESTVCLETRIPFAERLDRSDGVYLAKSVARFRVNSWIIRDADVFRCGTSFSTTHVLFNLGPVPAPEGLPAVVTVGWNFAVQ